MTLTFFLLEGSVSDRRYSKWPPNTIALSKSLTPGRFRALPSRTHGLPLESGFWASTAPEILGLRLPSS
jgi:hypothetical protein